MFSYIDIVRGEIAVEVGERFGVSITDEDTNGWRTLGDVARSVVGHTGGVATEAVVLDWVHTLIAEGYGVSTALTAEAEVFNDYDQAVAWFAAVSYPHKLGDRLFAKKPSPPTGGQAEPVAAPDPAS